MNEMASGAHDAPSDLTAKHYADEIASALAYRYRSVGAAPPSRVTCNFCAEPWSSSAVGHAAACPAGDALASLAALLALATAAQ